MINYFDVLSSLQATLAADSSLSTSLGTTGTLGRVILGPDFPNNVPPRFIMLAILSNDQSIESAHAEFSIVGITIAVKKASGVVTTDHDLISDIGYRVTQLINENPAALTLPNDTIAHLSRTGGLPPTVETIGTETYLISQERYELFTFMK